jgi:polyisoprenoid-binding protein YceI
MKSIALLSLALSLPTALLAADTVRYDGQPGGGKLTLEGTSSHGTWKVECAAIGGFIEADAAFPETAAGKPKVEVNIPVRSLKSGKKTMDNRMMKELKQEAFAKIEYKILELKPKGAPVGGKAQFDAVAALTVAGTTSTNTMPVTIERVDKTKLKVTGETALKMSQFKIPPPAFSVPLLGDLMKTGDDVKVAFEWTPEVEKK